MRNLIVTTGAAAIMAISGAAWAGSASDALRLAQASPETSPEITDMTPDVMGESKPGVSGDAVSKTRAANEGVDGTQPETEPGGMLRDGQASAPTEGDQNLPGGMKRSDEVSASN